MKNFSAQPLQLLSIGLVLACVGMIANPADAARSGRKARRAVQIEGIAVPSQMRRVTESTPLIVPEGQVFVVTGLCRERTSPLAYRVDVKFDGQTVLKTSFSYAPEGSGGMVCDVPPGFVAPAGTLIEAFGSNNAGGVVLGYLAQG